MYHLGPWGFAQVLNQYQYHVGVEQSYSDNVLTARSKKRTYNNIPPMEIIVIIIPKVSAVQCNIFRYNFFFSYSHLNIIHRPGKTADLMLQIPESAFPQLSQAQKI